MREIWGERELKKVRIETDEDLTENEKLLHGPQGKADGISKAEIDKLFE